MQFKKKVWMMQLSLYIGSLSIGLVILLVYFPAR